MNVPSIQTRVQQVVDSWQSKTGVVGVSVAIRRSGAQLAAASAGSADLATHRPFRPTDTTDVGSVTKLATAAVVVQLAGEGKLSLDEHVDRWFPELPEGDRITVRDLLKHTSGVPDFLREPSVNTGLWKPPGAPLGRYEPNEIASAMTRDHEPGAYWEYSNSNYHLLGEIIERVTGDRYEDQVRTRLLEPIGIDATTTFVVPQGPWGASTTPYWTPADPKTLEPSGPRRDWSDAYSAASMLRTSMWAEGGMVTDAASLARFGEALLWDKGPLLSPSDRARMLRPARTTRTADGAPADYGLGVMRMPYRHRPGLKVTPWMYGHNGHVPGYGTILGHLAGSDVTIAIEVNELSWSPKASAPANDLLLALLEITDGLPPAQST